MGVNFALKYRDTLLDLVDDTTLTVEWYSTLFNETEILRGSYSYSIELKLSYKNKTLLGMPHLLENSLSRQKIEISVLLFGHTWKNAILEYEVMSDRISGNLIIDNGIIAEWLRETTLPDMFAYFGGIGKIYETLNIGSNEYERLNYLANTCTAEPGTYPIALPGIYNYGWKGEYNRFGDIVETINFWSNENNTFLIVDRITLLCPMFYLTWLIRKVCAKLGFIAKGSFLEHKEVQRWIIYNNSYYTGTELRKSAFKIVIARHLPKITLGDFFKMLRNDLKLGIYFDSLSKTALFELPEVIIQGSERVSLGEMIIKDSLKIKPSAQKKYNIKIAKDETDKAYKEFSTIDSYIMGETDSLSNIELSIGSPIMRQPVPVNGVKFPRQPLVEQLANVYDEHFTDTPSFNKDGEIQKNEFSFRILSYRGLQSYDASNLSLKVSYATSDNITALGITDNTIIATDPTHESSWLWRWSKEFYQFSLLSEQLEFDLLTGIEKFSQLSPITKSSIRSSSGAKTSFLFDRITFEPTKGAKIYARVKGFSIPNTFALLGGNLTFKIGDKTIKEEVVYVSAWFVNTRTETTGGGQVITHYGKIFFQFYSDKYCTNLKPVTSLKLVGQVEDVFYFNNIATESEWYNIDETTGVSVTSHISNTEYKVETILPTQPSRRRKSNIILYVPEDESYFVVE